VEVSTGDPVENGDSFGDSPRVTGLSPPALWMKWRGAKKTVFPRPLY
jgi:hypothetical protein